VESAVYFNNFVTLQGGLQERLIGAPQHLQAARQRTITNGNLVRSGAFAPSQPSKTIGGDRKFAQMLCLEVGQKDGVFPTRPTRPTQTKQAVIDQTTEHP
jgi:hypothetical protein